ncbi:PREDICTED: protodermal factor 1 [Fragaria vesca subsp. vesca]|uniref:protodermal factor 1 n=1 Tax=Fragaria vesca subsp. vesca TaxID=101020 RepID=UPI0002C2EA09|nr:PREDICTED: protodermal factor 1 [Fragaria vesca subsp. vesca]
MGAMMRNKASSSLFIWALVAGMLSHNLVIPVMSTTFEDQKNYYTPDPGTGTPPPSGHGGSTTPGGSHGSPPSHHHTPSHSNPPSHGSYNPSPSPPTNCGTPPSRLTPTPSRPTTPSTPTYGTPPSTPTYGTPPSTPTYRTPPSTPLTPPVIVTPPIIGTPPIDPGTPGVPTPPYLPNPNSPPFTCTYWRNHPTVIWGLVGWWATMGHTFGLTSLPGFGSSTMNLQQALSNTRTDGVGELYREGTAALLNSMVDNRFHFTTTQVRDSFVRGLSSNKAAKNQARLFRLANEGKLKPRA